MTREFRKKSIGLSDPAASTERSTARVSEVSSTISDNRNRALQMRDLGGRIQSGSEPTIQLGKGDNRGDKYRNSTKDYLAKFQAQQEEEYSDSDYSDDEYSDDVYYELDGSGVLEAWDANSDWESIIFNPTPRADWDYNATMQWDVEGYKLRCHVHYYKNMNGGYRKVKGNGWVSGIDNFQFPTPKSVVDNAPSVPKT